MSFFPSLQIEVNIIRSPTRKNKKKNILFQTILFLILTYIISFGNCTSLFCVLPLIPFVPIRPFF